MLQIFVLRWVWKLSIPDYSCIYHGTMDWLLIWFIYEYSGLDAYPRVTIFLKFRRKLCSVSSWCIFNSFELHDNRCLACIVNQQNYKHQHCPASERNAMKIHRCWMKLAMIWLNSKISRGMFCKSYKSLTESKRPVILSKYLSNSICYNSMGDVVVISNV